MAFIKKMLAMLLIVMVVLLGDIVMVYAASTRLREALGNAVDGALVINMDNAAMTYSDMDTVIEKSRRGFFDVLKQELELGSDLKNNSFFRHGVTIDTLHISWHDGYPVVRAQISVKLDTVLLGNLIVPEYAEVRINNFDHLYWQWAGRDTKEWIA